MTVFNICKVRDIFFSNKKKERGGNVGTDGFLDSDLLPFSTQSCQTQQYTEWPLQLWLKKQEGYQITAETALVEYQDAKATS